MEDDAPTAGEADQEKVDISSTLSPSSARLSSSSSTSRSRPTWGKVMRQTWARTSSRRLNSKSSTAPAVAAAGGPAGGGLSKSAPEKDDENEDKKRSKAKKERTKTTKKTRIRIDKALEERRALTSDFSSSSSSSSSYATTSPSYISSASSSSYSRYGTFAQSASATLTATGGARGPRGRFGYESLRAGRIAPLAASGPWDDTVSWVIDERRPRKVEERSGRQRTAASDVTAGKDRDSVARRDRVAGGEKKEKAKEPAEEEESEEPEPEAMGEDAAEEKGAFDLLRAYYPHSLASLTSLTTKKGKEKSENESESESEREDKSESESDRDKIVKTKGTGGEETKYVKIASEGDNEREGGKEKRNEASSGKRSRRKRRAVSAKRNDEGRLLRLRAKLCKSGDILLCMRRERSYDDDDGAGSGDGSGGVSTPESSPELQGRDGRGRRADGEGQAQAETDAAAPEAKTKKPATPRREEKESEAERAMEREMEELWKRASKPRRCSEPFAFPSRRSRGKARRADGEEAVGGGSGSRDRSNTISSFVLAFEERKDLSQLARERDQEKSERKSRWRAYSFITPRRNRNGSNVQPAALATPSSSPSSSALPHDSPAAGVVQGRQRSSSLGAPRPNVNFIEQPLRHARSLSDDEGGSGGLDDDDDIYGGGAANTFVDLDNRPRPHQQLLQHQQQLKAQRDRRRRGREAADRKEEDERPHETARDNGSGNGSKSESGAKPSWRNLKLLFSSER